MDFHCRVFVDVNVRKNCKFYALDNVRRIYVVQFPMHRFFLVFTYVTRTYTHVAIASVFMAAMLEESNNKICFHKNVNDFFPKGNQFIVSPLQYIWPPRTHFIHQLDNGMEPALFNT